MDLAIFIIWLLSVRQYSDIDIRLQSSFVTWAAFSCREVHFPFPKNVYILLLLPQVAWAVIKTDQKTSGRVRLSRVFSVSGDCRTSSSSSQLTDAAITERLQRRNRHLAQGNSLLIHQHRFTAAWTVFQAAITPSTPSYTIPSAVDSKTADQTGWTTEVKGWII